MERATYIAEVEVTSRTAVTWWGPASEFQGERCSLSIQREWLGHAESGSLDLYVDALDACPPLNQPLMLFAGPKVYFSSQASSESNPRIRHLAPFGDMVVPVVSWSWFIERDGLVHVPARGHAVEGWPWEALRDEVAARVVGREGLVLPGAPAPKSDRAQPAAAVAPLPRRPPTDAHRPPPFVDGRRHLSTRDEYRDALLRYGVPGPRREHLERATRGEALSDADYERLDQERARIATLPQMQNLGVLASAVTGYRLAADYGGHDELASMLREREIWLRGLHSDGEVPPDVVRAHACALVDVGPDCPMRAWPGCQGAEDISTLARSMCADPLTLPVIPQRGAYSFNTPPGATTTPAAP